MSVLVVGQGYVGLPLSKAACDTGCAVTGLDLNESKVDALNSGRSVVDDLTDADIASMLERGYRAVTDPAAIEGADVIIICVPTPLAHGGAPDLTAVHAAVRSVAERVSRGALVVLESTTYPGTTHNEVRPVLEEGGYKVGSDIYLAYSPERIDPGNKQFGIRNTPKVVGADDAESLAKAKEFYERIVDQVVTVKGTAEAELSKLLENTYRHINIGLVNELAQVCHELGIDVWEVVRAAATKPFGFEAFYPGPGVGGHCIPIDPSYLNHAVRGALGRPFRFVELAQDVNSTMPAYIVARVQDLLNRDGKALKGAEVLLLGITYKTGIADTRETPAEHIARGLEAKGAMVRFFDPLVEEWETESGRRFSRVSDLGAANRAADVTVLLQQISSLSADSLAEEANAFLDTRGVTKSAKAHLL